MKRTQKWSAVLVVVSLLLSSFVQIATAQDNPNDSNAQLPQHVYIPLVSNNPDQTTVEQQTKTLTPVDGSISPISSESVDKETVKAARQGVGALHPVSLIVTFDSSVDINTVQTPGGGKVIHRYSQVFHGISVVTSSDTVDAIASMSGVTGVYPDELMHLDTDVTPGFIGAPSVWNALGGQGKAGEGVVVGVLDSGIWPEHPSFSDPDPSGKPYAAPAHQPSQCKFGSETTGDAEFHCNNKLIGAYRFMDTYEAVVGLGAGEFKSARDDDGHGTHTASTAAGNAKVPAKIFGVDRGLISGIAPRAQVIMYKVCGAQGCFSSDSAAAVDQAIQDQVNAINFSISGGSNPYADAVELAFRNAYDHGIFVAASAGNSGPGLNTTDHRGPWVTTVAASTSNRAFVSTVSLKASNGDTLNLQGSSLMGGISTPTPVIASPDPACGVQPAGTFHGEIVVCVRGLGGLGRVQKGFNALNAGAGGMILRNPTVQDTETDNHFLPAVHLDAPAGDQLVAFLSGHTGVTATFTPGVKTPATGDIMAAFSSRGGPAQTLGVSKPDVTAPGVQILAGASPLHVDVAAGPNGELFQAIAGTSMSSPHVAGAGALLKALHPDWTPGQIKSALMTTAKTKGVVKEDGVTPADSFDYGSGRIDLNAAGNPGITFDETAANYVAQQKTLWNANYPSFYHPGLPGAITVQRTAKDVSGKKSEWELKTTTDKNDWQIIVPNHFKLPANGQTTFNITVEARNVPLGQVRQGMIWLKGEKVTLHIPVTFVRGQAVVTINKACTPTDFAAKGGSTTCTITMQNTAFSNANVNMVDQLPQGLQLIPGTLVGGTQLGRDKIGFSGALQGAAPPQVSASLVDIVTTPAGGYLPLRAFNGSVVVSGGDETIANFNVPAFLYGGETYTRIGIVSDGYIVVGGGTAADVQFLNTNFPNATPPNNVLAPFWSDLNPAFGGTMRINVLGDGTNSWIVVDWDGVVNYSDRKPNQFEVWIGINGTQDITYVYGATSNGEAGSYTVGAENRFGNSGQAIYYSDGTTSTGTSPSTFGATQAVQVNGVAGAPGPVQTVSFKLKADKKGKWQNCAEMTADSFQGTAISCTGGQVK